MSIQPLGVKDVRDIQRGVCEKIPCGQLDPGLHLGLHWLSNPPAPPYLAPPQDHLQLSPRAEDMIREHRKKPHLS